MFMKTFETILEVMKIELVLSFMKCLVPKGLKSDVNLGMLIISYILHNFFKKRIKKIQFPLFLTVNDYPSKNCSRFVSPGNTFL